MLCGGGGGSVAQPCLTLCDPMDSSPPGSSIHGIFQARILEWVAIFYSRGSFGPRDLTSICCVSFIGRWILLPLVPPGKPSVTIYHANKKSLCESVTIHPWLHPSLPYFPRIQIYLVSTHQPQLPSRPLGSVWPPASPLFKPPLAAHRLHTRPTCPSPTPGVYSKSCPLSQ